MLLCERFVIETYKFEWVKYIFNNVPLTGKPLENRMNEQVLKWPVKVELINLLE